MFKKKRKLRKLRNRVNAGKKIVLFSLYFFSISAAAGGGYYFLLQHTEQSLPYVSPLASVKGMKTEAAKDDNHVLIEKQLKAKHIPFNSVKAEDDKYIITLQDDAKVTFSAKKDIMTQISSLQFILSRLTMEGKLFSQLDLRFEKPVITLKGK